MRLNGADQDRAPPLRNTLRTAKERLAKRAPLPLRQIRTRRGLNEKAPSGDGANKAAAHCGCHHRNLSSLGLSNLQTERPQYESCVMLGMVLFTAIFVAGMGLYVLAIWVGVDLDPNA